MKKLMGSILALILTLTFFSCSAETRPSSRVLVVFFSATGTTRAVAEQVSDILCADLYEILPEQPYTESDLAYYTGGRCDREQDDPSVRPAIAGEPIDISPYDTILIGYPIWHGQAPRIISTFLESCDFSGKTMAAFCTSRSSGIGTSDKNLQQLVSNRVTWLSGQRFPAGAPRQAIEDWLNGIGIEAEREEPQVGEFDFDSKTVLLNSGYTMPILGLGTYALDYDTCVNSV